MMHNDLPLWCQHLVNGFPGSFATAIATIREAHLTQPINPQRKVTCSRNHRFKAFGDCTAAHDDFFAKL